MYPVLRTMYVVVVPIPNHGSSLSTFPLFSLRRTAATRWDLTLIGLVNTPPFSPLLPSVRDLGSFLPAKNIQDLTLELCRGCCTVPYFDSNFNFDLNFFTQPLLSYPTLPVYAVRLKPAILPETPLVHILSRIRPLSVTQSQSRTPAVSNWRPDAISPAEAT